MSTCRDVIREALGAIRALAPGDDPVVDELTAGLAAVQRIVLDLHEGRGPLTDVDVTADYVAGENQRVRIQDGYTVEVELPNSVLAASSGARSPTGCDYGFAPSSMTPPAGSLNPADGFTYRAPRDGSRIEVVGTSNFLWFYRSDTNAWTRADSLAIDDELPLNARYVSHLGALVAERLVEVWPGLYEPTKGLLKRISRANSALLHRPGVARDPVTSQYF